MKSLAYINLWGTTAKLNEDSVLGRPEDVALAQAHFHAKLGELAAHFPELEIHQAADLAYVVGEAAETVHFTVSLMRSMLTRENLWPVRAALVQDGAAATHFTREKNFTAVQIPGPAAIEAARLEKSAQKGFRLFTDTATANEFQRPWLRERQTRGHRHFEINWLDSRIPSLLSVTDPAILKNLQDRAHSLIEEGSNYAQQMGASILEILRDCEQRNTV